mgnify:CR=1 FL=1
MTDAPSSRPLPGSGGWIRPLATASLVVLLVGWLLAIAGPTLVAGRLASISPTAAVRLGILAILPLVVWGVALRSILQELGVQVGLFRATALLVASVFFNNVTPFGQLGGDPPSAVLIGHVTGSRIETGLAGITSLNVLNRLAGVVLGIVGLVTLLGPFGPVEGPWVEAALGLSLSGIIFAILVWLYANRWVVAAIIGPIVAGLAVRTARLLPGVTPPEATHVRARVDAFVALMERIGSAPRRLFTVLVLGVIGQALVAVVLWSALGAIGARVPPALVLVVVPTAKLSGLAPTPGGSGTAVALVAALLAATTGLSLATATTGAILYRVAAFWMPTVIGGVIAVWLALRRG